MVEILKLVASIEWIVVGVYSIVKMRQWNKRFRDLYDDFRNEFKKEYGE